MSKLSDINIETEKVCIYISIFFARLISPASSERDKVFNTPILRIIAAGFSGISDLKLEKAEIRLHISINDRAWLLNQPRIKTPTTPSQLKLILIRQCLFTAIWLCSLPLLTYYPARGANRQPLISRVILQDEIITPATARFISRSLRQAHENETHCVILELNTPGGLMDSTERIVRLITGSSIPVVVYVSPSGGRAASAGVFITLASHIAAMTPGTRIGSAHPVQAGPSQSFFAVEEYAGQKQTEENDMDVAEEKALRDAIAWARSLAELRDRNAEWAVSTVEDNVSSSAREAFDSGAIEILADSFDQLLEELDGREVVIDDETISLRTRDAAVEEVRMWWGEELLSFLANPNIALLLLIIGFYGILFELYSPGWGIPGSIGALSMVIGLYGLAILPINYAGLLLMVAGLTLFVAEALITSFGLLAISGVICLVLGGAMLIESPQDFMQISLGILIPVAAATAFITFFLITSIIKGMRSPVRTGSEALTEKTATAVEDFTKTDKGYRGKIWLRGEYWNAASDRPVSADSKVTTISQSGLILKVKPYSESNNKEKR